MDDFELPLDADEAKDEIEDDVPADVDTRCKTGDVWQLGEHRLMCGDSTSQAAVEILMDGQKADMVFTDPPYGMSLDTDYSKMGNSSINHRKVIGDNEDFCSDLITTIFQFSYVKEMFIFGADYFAELLPNKNEGSWIVWDKRSDGESGIGKMDGMFGSAFELCWSKSKHKRDIARFTRYTSDYTGDEKPVHPTQKPVKLINWFLDKWSKSENLIVDLFGGSGSTLIACEKTNRKCFMMELDEKYCDVILARWEGYANKKAVLEIGQ
jgi:DNA modification methylase